MEIPIPRQPTLPTITLLISHHLVYLCFSNTIPKKGKILCQWYYFKIFSYASKFLALLIRLVWPIIIIELLHQVFFQNYSHFCLIRKNQIQCFFSAINDFAKTSTQTNITCKVLIQKILNQNVSSISISAPHSESAYSETLQSEIDPFCFAS